MLHNVFLSTDIIYISSFQCAIAVDNLATYYFNNITMGEAPNSPAAIRFAQHIADCPSLFPEVTPLSLFSIDATRLIHFFV